MLGIENSWKTFRKFRRPQRQRLYSCPWNISLPGSAVGGAVGAPMLNLNMVREFEELCPIFDDIKLGVDEDVPRVQDRRQRDYGLNSTIRLNKKTWTLSAGSTALLLATECCTATLGTVQASISLLVRNSLQRKEDST